MTSTVATVDKELAKNEGKQVNVFIDSLCGSLAPACLSPQPSVTTAMWRCISSDSMPQHSPQTVPGADAPMLRESRSRWLRTMMDSPRQWNNEGFMSEEDFDNIRSNM
ncbi:MAG: hypothetical protein K2I48_07570 [Muribaculaceae bacterium]|nr:hypothetical protein [Muribaculaceae bacterium]